jgi:SNF2 family DNA or RNA helicase
MKAWRPEVIVLDEAHRIKNHKAKRAKAIIRLGIGADHKFILTGTPILNSVTDIFNMYLFLDDGATFGKNYYVFQQRYMEDENAAWSGKSNGFKKWVTRSETYGELSDKVYERGHRVLTKDVIDLPPLVRMVRNVELGPDQRRAYKEMERDFITFVENKENSGEPAAVVATIAAVKALRLQQIASGYMSDEDGNEHTFDKNPRADLLEELVQEIVVDGGNSCILWCSFKQNYKQLSAICKKLKIPHCFITGQQNLEEKTQSMNDFNAGIKPVVIANRKAGGIGINLIKAKYSITYSRNFSLEEELQSSARNYRGGSQIHDKIIKIDISASDTIDEVVAEALYNKKDISNKIIDVVKGRV